MDKEKKETTVTQKTTYVYETKKEKKQGFPLGLNITLLIFGVLALVFLAIPYFMGDLGGLPELVGSNPSLLSLIFDGNGAGYIIKLILFSMFQTEIIVYVFVALVYATFIIAILDIIFSILMFFKPIQRTALVTVQKVLLMTFGIINFIVFLGFLALTVFLFMFVGTIELAIQLGGIALLGISIIGLVQFILKLCTFSRTSRPKKVVVTEETKVA